MNRHYLTQIKVESLLHLKNLVIHVPSEDKPHILITGRNGVGKTTLMNAIVSALEDSIERYESPRDVIEYRKGDVSLSLRISDGYWAEYWRSEKFIIAHYPAFRRLEMDEPETPSRVQYPENASLRHSHVDQFLNFLVDLKFQEAMARNENLPFEAQVIREWFDTLEKLLKDLYADSELKLEFNFRSYEWRIITEGKSFKFTELADGFAAILYIVCDLMLKMQRKNILLRPYMMHGIVFIDEIETHLHIELQQRVMLFLTSLFPLIQFIVTTHSPFILHSTADALAYDLERREAVDDLPRYSFETLAEGYFGAKTESGYLVMLLEEFRQIMSKPLPLAATQRNRLRQLYDYFTDIPSAVSPSVMGEFQQLCIARMDHIRALSTD